MSRAVSTSRLPTPGAPSIVASTACPIDAPSTTSDRRSSSDSRSDRASVRQFQGDFLTARLHPLGRQRKVRSSVAALRSHASPLNRISAFSRGPGSHPEPFRRRWRWRECLDTASPISACAVSTGRSGIEPADVGLGSPTCSHGTAVYLSAAFAFPVLILAVPMLWYPGSAHAGRRSGRSSRGCWPCSAFSWSTSHFWGWAFIDPGQDRGRQAGAGVLHSCPGQTPWSAVAWTDSGGPALPACATGSERRTAPRCSHDPKGSRTIRVPQSAVAVSIRPHSEGR